MTFSYKIGLFMSFLQSFIPQTRLVGFITLTCILGHAGDFSRAEAFLLEEVPPSSEVTMPTEDAVAISNESESQASEESTTEFLAGSGEILARDSESMAVVKGPAGVQSEQLFFSKYEEATTIDLSETILLANEDSSVEEKYPLSVKSKNLTETLILEGGVVIGQQSRNLTWSEMKQGYDGDASRMETAGHKVVDGFYAENVEDGFSPRGGGTWEVKNSWFHYIRDDGVENDQLLSGKILNTLFDGVNTFLSNRPGKSRGIAAPPEEEPIVDIQGSLVWMQPMRNNHRKVDHYDASGELASGSLFKWSQYGGEVRIKDTIFRVDQLAGRGRGAMTFPEGTYENVTLVWLGEGDYPVNLPEGITVTTDLSVWQSARNAWIEANAFRFRHSIREIALTDLGNTLGLSRESLEEKIELIEMNPEEKTVKITLKDGQMGEARLLKRNHETRLPKVVSYQMAKSKAAFGSETAAVLPRIQKVKMKWEADAEDPQVSEISSSVNLFYRHGKIHHANWARRVRGLTIPCVAELESCEVISPVRPVKLLRRDRYRYLDGSLAIDKGAWHRRIAHRLSR